MHSTNGVILLAFGKREYVFMACHMAASIRRYSPELHITLVVDESKKYVPKSYEIAFDEIKDLAVEDYILNGRIDPGYAKCNIDKYLSCDNNIFLDVDGICLQDLTPLFDKTDKYFATIVTGRGGFEDVINYSFWASNASIWEYFKLKKDQQYSAIQSSFMFLKRGEELTELFNMIRKNFSFPMEHLINHWGGTMPDELIIAGSCAQLDHDPSFPVDVVFFGHKLSKLTLAELQQNFYINSLYGNGKGRTLVKDVYKDWYNRQIVKTCQKVKVPLLGKAFQLMKTKHAGGK